MKIDVFSIMKNEEYMLPYFLRHYDFADRIFIFNDGSTDKTKELAEANPKVTLLNFPYDRGLNEKDFSECFEQAFRNYSRGHADWAICVDADEFIYHPNIRKYLENTDLRTLRPIGYTMVCETLPTTKGQIYEECKTGVRTPAYDKPVVFDPELDVYLGHGRHTINLVSHVSELKLLHFRYLSPEYFLERNKENFEQSGMDEKNINYRTRRAKGFYKVALAEREEVI